MVAAIEIAEHYEPQGNVEKAQSHHDKSHDSSAPEGNLKAAVEPRACGVGSACRCVSGCFHAEKTGKAGEESASKECKRHPWILNVEHVSHKCEDESEHDEYERHNFVLLLQVSHGTASHMTGNLFHPCRSFFFFHHLAEEDPRHPECTY